ncbi:MAG: hypothetical protein WCJ07_02640 [Verrucomicrobiota bacterium]
MKNNSSDSRESFWRNNLSPAERGALKGSPELELEARLTAALSKIPDAQVPSNFTARILAAVDLEENHAVHSRNWTLNWRQLWPRFAVAAAVLIFAGVSLQRYESNAHRITLAKNVVRLASSQPLPSIEVLENLDAIQRMNLPARADGELLAALQ